jgi:hypothetical protein
MALVAPLCAFAFIKSGLFDVAASRPHTKLTEWITHETMIHSARRHATSIAWPRSFTLRQTVSGFCAYEAHCVACHGAPAVPRATWVSGMEPSPPYLLDTTSRWTPSQLFWITKNGIKMTGMPSWRDSMPDIQISAVVGFLESMRRLPPETYLDWRSRRICGPNKGPLSDFPRSTGSGTQI